MPELTYIPYCNCKRSTARYMKRTGEYKCNKCGNIVDDVKSLMPRLLTDEDDTPASRIPPDSPYDRHAREYEMIRELEATGEY